MFHARLVVHHDVLVVGGQMIHGHGQVLVGRAVAARPIGLAHGHEVEAGGLHQGLMHLHLHVLIPGHVGRHVALEFLSDLADGGVKRKPQQFVEVGVGIGIHGQDGGHVPFGEVFDEQGRDGGLADPALAGQGNDFWHLISPVIVFLRRRLVRLLALLTLLSSPSLDGRGLGGG